MEVSSLTIKEEKAALAEMKKMAKDAKVSALCMPGGAARSSRACHVSVLPCCLPPPHPPPPSSLPSSHAHAAAARVDG
jgi:hypothetical protein